METLFWASAALIFYVYAGYPLMLGLWARVVRARQGVPRRSHEIAEFATESSRVAVDPWADYSVAHDEGAPGVSIVIAVRNEAHRLSARVENLLSLHYPGARQIIVVSDGSTDDPARALAHAPAQVELICLPPGGKAAALNAGVARAQHDILVFADARQTFAPDALQKLVAHFDDPAVGGVSGELLLDTEHGAASGEASVAEGVGMYWRYEKALRRMESVVGSTLGATGAIYALRRALWTPLPNDTLLDDVLAPMRAVLAGYKVVFEDGAKAYDRASRDAASESRRKVRTLAGNIQLLWLEPRLLIPFVNPVWLQYVSHKLGRLVVPYALMTLFAASIVLAIEHWVYAVALFGQATFYLLAVYGAWLSSPALGVKHVQDA
jgi:cellulose synthase/poly-beta-1,6-N-acetylglucosamine synthase-like glycosyltransferase